MNPFQLLSNYAAHSSWLKGIFTSGWGAFGFLFVIGTLSFADARPREASHIDYIEDDEFDVGDFIGRLRWEGGALIFDADYVRGRRVKTRIVLRPDGSGRLTTTGRGKAPILWLERLKGKKLLRIVPPLASMAVSKRPDPGSLP